MTRVARRTFKRGLRAIAAIAFSFAAAVGVVGAAWAGMVLAGDRPLPDATAGNAKAARPHAAGRDWAELASGACAHGRRQTMALFDRSDRFPGTQAQVTVRVLRGATRIEGRLLARLQRLHPGPADRGAYREALRLFRAEYASDRRLVSQLSRSGLGIAVQSRHGEARDGQIRLRFYQVGAFGCATYFDPRSW